MRPIPTLSGRLLVIAALLLSACQDVPTELRPNGARNDASPAIQDPTEPITRALAAALKDPTLKMQLLHDLRDSPFHHRIHLKSYLLGNRGRVLLTAGADALRIPRNDLAVALARLPELELLVPSNLDRIRWTGEGDVIVVGSTMAGSQPLTERVLTGYSTTGAQVTQSFFDRPPLPSIAILPVREAFGTNPEEVRQRAPTRNRRTIEPPEGEVSPMIIDPIPTCDPTLTTCDDGTGGGGGGGTTPLIGPAAGVIHLPSGFGYADCAIPYHSTGDADADGVRDQCEYELASAFRPYLKVNPFDYDLRREEAWAVSHRTDGSAGVHIFYALSYYFDAGEDETGYRKHYGDSEWVILYPKHYADGSWAVSTIKMSAHWGTFVDATRVYRWDELSYPLGPAGGRPTVYVAKNKHSNYNNGSNCDTGSGLTSGWSDDCSGNMLTLASLKHQINVFPDRNLGSSTYSSSERSSRSRGA
jgi:hypothetical protein